jgi:hypothetical protein
MDANMLSKLKNIFLKSTEKTKRDCVDKNPLFIGFAATVLCLYYSCLLMAVRHVKNDNVAGGIAVILDFKSQVTMA